ncbi:MAG TPA: lipase [Nostocaceae cyanobacterium]|nr:lipase [Nostocaceae cyanobacterium]
MPLPTVILPGYLESAVVYRPLELSLQDLGFPAVTVPLRRRDWLPLIGGKPVTPIIQQLDQTVKRVLQQYQTTQINLIGHSAGGWISRIYIGEKPYGGKGQLQTNFWGSHPLIATLITLGTPHISRERWTRWNLDFVNNNYPGAFYPHVRYVCVAGKAILGARQPGSWLAHSSYKLTCGQGDTWGDGITPIASAHLNGAENLILDGVRHSPKSPGIWYGSPSVFATWADYLA